MWAYGKEIAYKTCNGCNLLSIERHVRYASLKYQDPDYDDCVYRCCGRGGMSINICNILAYDDVLNDHIVISPEWCPSEKVNVGIWVM